MGRPPAWVLGEVLTSPHCKSISMLQNVTECYTWPRAWMDFLQRYKQLKIDIKSEPWNVRSLHSVRSLTTITRKFAKY